MFYIYIHTLFIWDGDFFFCIYLRPRSADCAFLCLGYSYIYAAAAFLKGGGGELAGTSTYRAVFFFLSFSQIQDTTNERTNDDVFFACVWNWFPLAFARAKTPEPKPVQRCKTVGHCVMYATPLFF